MKKRLDILVYEKGFTDSREKAKAIIMSGQVSPFLMPSSKNHTLSKSAAKSTAFSSIGLILQSFNMQISTPCFARVSRVIVICSEITDCGKSEQD